MEFLFELGEIHALLLLATAVVIVYSDHQGFLYFRGTKETLSRNFIVWSHRLVWTGLALIILTGVLLTILAWEYRLSEGVFWIKMGFVAVLLMNGIAIGSLSHKSTTTPFASLSKAEQKTLLVSGVLSFTGWVSAAIIGYFIL